MSIREEFSPETFIRLKDAGIDYAELGLRAPQFYADSSEREEFCRRIKKAAAEAGVRIWSIHIPYGKQWDISDPFETVRQDVIKRHKKLFEIFEFLQPQKAIIHPSFEPNPPEEHMTRMEACRKSLSVLAADYSGPFLLEYRDSPENKAAKWKELKRNFIQNSEF